MIEGVRARPRSARRAGGVARAVRDAVSGEVALYGVVLGAVYLIQGTLWFWLLGALAGAMLTLAVLLFGAISTSDSSTSAEL